MPNAPRPDGPADPLDTAWTVRYSDPAEMDRLLRSSSPGPGRTMLEGFLAWRDERLDDALRLLSEVAQDDAAPTTWQGRALSVRANVLTELGLFAQAQADLLVEIAQCRTDGLDFELAAAVHDLGDVYSHTAPEQALTHFLDTVERCGVLRAGGGPQAHDAAALEALAVLNLHGVSAEYGLQPPDGAPSLAHAQDLAQEGWPELGSAILAQRILDLLPDDVEGAASLAADLPDETTMRDVTNASIVAQAHARMAAARGLHVEAKARLTAFLPRLSDRYAVEILADLDELSEQAGDLATALAASRRRLEIVQRLNARDAGARVRALEVWHRTRSAEIEARAARAEAKAAQSAADGLRAQVDTLLEHSQRDPLTGLWNRARLADVAADASRQGSLAVAVIDIDQFKQINDHHGHAAGDAALQQVADRLQALSRPGDVMVRTGGDEFVVLRPGSDGTDLEADLAGVTHLSTPQGRRFTMSVGVAAASGQDVGAVFERADLRMYQAKRAGGARVVDR